MISNECHDCQPPRTRDGEVDAVRISWSRRQVEPLFKNCFQLGLVGMAITSPTKGCVDVNDELCRILGYEREELLEKSWAEMTHPEDLAADVAQFERVTAGEIDGYSMDKRWFRKDGQIVHSIISVECVRGTDGCINHFVALVQDISERKRAEQRLHESERSLTVELASMTRLQEISTRLVPTGDSTSLLEEIVDAAIAITAADMGNIQLLDRDGRTLQLVASRGFDGAFLRFFDVANADSGCCGAAIQTGKRVVVEDVATSPVFAGTASLAAVLGAGIGAIQSTPLMSRSGHLVGVLSTHYRAARGPAERDLRVLDLLARQAADWIERTQAEEERQTLLESESWARTESERAARLKDDFLATLSHELRSPLNAILGWTQLIKAASGDLERVSRGVAAIDRNARAQSLLIADMLDLSRIITGKMRLNVHRIELPVVLDAAIEAVRPAALARGIRIDSAIEPIAQPMHGDATRLQQVLWNLLSNAVKFTPEGGRVDVSLARVDSGVEIVVSDTGKGICPDFLPHVFERFRQADASTVREHGGLGIGLSLVKQLTELHGGEVRAGSEGEGKGSTFTVRLPLPVQAQDDVPQKHPPVPASMTLEGGPLQLDGVKVLVVDDEPDTLEVIQQVLEDRRAKVVIAGSVENALAALETEPFDVLLSDIGMPRRDGYELISELRKRGLKTPAVAVTAFARSEDRTRALLSGYQAHITKPLEASELLATVAALSGRIGSGDSFV